MPIGSEPPAVVAALDLAAVEMAGRQWHAAMRADVAQRENRAVAVAPNEDWFAQHDPRENPAAPQQPARRRVVPGLAQRRRAVLRFRHGNLSVRPFEPPAVRAPQDEGL